MDKKINITIYNEFYHETVKENVRDIYPQGIHGVIKEFLSKNIICEIRCATLENHKEVMTQELLDDTDVLIWWGHAKHREVSDDVVEMAANRILHGMGFIALHSAHASKLFKRLMGTDSKQLRWRESGDKVRLWNIAPNHCITQGLAETFVVPHDETYGEPFEIPDPEQIIFMSWFQGGEVLRSGCTWRRGEGKIFFFQNGHETFPVYYQKEIQTVITNAVKWACPIKRNCLVDRGGSNAPAYEH